MTYIIEISKQADADLRGIFEYIGYEVPLFWLFHILLIWFIYGNISRKTKDTLEVDEF